MVKLLDTGGGKQGALLELLGSRLATHFGILVAEPVAVLIDAEFAALLSTDDRFANRAQLIQSNVGLNFGSRYLSPVTQWQAGRNIPAAMFDMAASIFAFDALIQNVDRRATNPNLFVTGNDIYVYEHETSFSFLQAILPSPQPWILEAELYLKEHIFYSGLRGRAIELRDFCERLSALSDTVLQEFRDEVPQEWIHGCLDSIERHLKSVREHTEEFSMQVKRSLR